MFDWITNDTKTSSSAYAGTEIDQHSVNDMHTKKITRIQLTPSIHIRQFHIVNGWFS